MDKQQEIQRLKALKITMLNPHLDFVQQRLQEAKRTIAEKKWAFLQNSIISEITMSEKQINAVFDIIRKSKIQLQKSSDGTSSKTIPQNNSLTNASPTVNKNEMDLPVKKKEPLTEVKQQILKPQQIGEQKKDSLKLEKRHGSAGKSVPTKDKSSSEDNSKELSSSFTSSLDRSESLDISNRSTNCISNNNSISNDSGCASTSTVSPDDSLLSGGNGSNRIQNDSREVSKILSKIAKPKDDGKAFQKRLKLLLRKGIQSEMKNPTHVLTQTKNFPNLKIVKVESLNDMADKKMEHEMNQVPVAKCARPVKPGPKRSQTKAVEEIEKELQEPVIKKPRQSCKELDKLHGDIREMYYANDIVHLTNQRLVGKPKNFYKESRIKSNSAFHPDEVIMIETTKEASEMKKQPKPSSIDKPDLSHEKRPKYAENKVRDQDEDTKRKNIEESNKNEQKKKVLKTLVLSSNKSKYLNQKTLGSAPSSRLIINSRYTSIHFNVSEVRLGILCRCNFCNFETTDKNNLMQHMSQSHNYQTWSGFCVECNKRVAKEESSLKDELNHLIFHANFKETETKERKDEKKDEKPIKSSLPNIKKFLEKCTFISDSKKQRKTQDVAVEVEPKPNDSKKQRKTQDVAAEVEPKPKRFDKPTKIQLNEPTTKSNNAEMEALPGFEDWNVEELKKKGL